MDIAQRAKHLRQMPVEKLPLSFAVDPMYLLDSARPAEGQSVLDYVREQAGPGLMVTLDVTTDIITVKRVDDPQLITSLEGLRDRLAVSPGETLGFCITRRHLENLYGIKHWNSSEILAMVRHITGPEYSDLVMYADPVTQNILVSSHREPRLESMGIISG